MDLPPYKDLPPRVISFQVPPPMSNSPTPFVTLFTTTGARCEKSMPRFLSCFSPRSSSTFEAESLQVERAPLSSDAKPEFVKDCPFCVASRERGFAVVRETSDLVAFRDRSPQAETHLLIIPRPHTVSTVRDLRIQHISLLMTMRDLADELVPNTPTKTGFHIPPFSSVHHLHLHVLAGKRTTLGRFKYPDRARGDGKGWSWFVTLEQTIRILESGGRITLRPS